jgi:hypothetical protein
MRGKERFSAPESFYISEKLKSEERASFPALTGNSSAPIMRFSAGSLKGTAFRP